jgi:RNA recognition motif-containing protein
MKLLIRNLAKATTEEKLLTLFKEHGNIQSCNLVLDKETGESKGFAFIEMPKVGEAKAAIKNLNGYQLAGNLIRVKKAEMKKETTEEASVTAPLKTEIKPQKAASKPVKEITTTDKEKIWGSVKR